MERTKRKRTQISFRSFIKNGKERKVVPFFWKEQMPIAQPYLKKKTPPAIGKENVCIILHNHTILYSVAR